MAGCDRILPGQATRLLLAASAGGASDRFARLLAGAIERISAHRIVIENEARAAGLLAVDRLARAAPDGRTFGFVPSALLYEAVLGRTRGPWRLDAFDWIASIGKDDRVLVVNAAVKEDFADLVASRRRLVLAANSRMSTNYIEAQVVRHLTGVRLDPVPGYDGGARTLAFVSGEVEGAVVGLDATRPLLEASGSRVLLTLTPTEAPGLMGVPTLAPYARGGDAPPLLDLIGQVSAMGRLFALPPGCPTPVVSRWRALMSRVLADPEFRRASAAQDFGLDHIQPDRITPALSTLVGPDSGAAAALRRALATPR